jgi:hypothetical protein
MDAPPRTRRLTLRCGASKHVAPRLKRTLSLGVFLVLVGVGCGSSGQLGAKALLEQSDSLRSEAAEGALLAEDAVAGKVTRIYTREHSFDLSTAASEIEAALRAATTDAALEPKLRQLRDLASQISADLMRLASASTAEQRALTRELQAAARASQRVGQGLA